MNKIKVKLMVTASAATQDCSPLGQDESMQLRKISSSFTKQLEMLADAAEQDSDTTPGSFNSPQRQALVACDSPDEEESKSLEMKPQK